jgi:ankyrin repeat protein
LVELLLDRKADFDRKDTQGRTALFLAAETRHKEVVELLLDRGANVNDRTPRGQAPLDRAAFRGHREIAELLLDNGAQIDGKGRLWLPGPLFKAASSGHKDVVELLVDKGAKIDERNWYSSTPLAIAAFAGHKEVVELLLDEGAEIDVKDADGWTPLHTAAFKGHAEVVKSLLKRGALSSRRTNKGEVARELTKKKKILDLLLHPPAVETRGPGERQRTLKKDPPSETNQARQAVCKDFEAQIAYYLPGYVQRQSFSVHDLIYNPKDKQARLKKIEEKARSKAKENAAERVKKLAKDMTASDKSPTTPNESHNVSEMHQEPWRWIHLPANNVRENRVFQG